MREAPRVSPPMTIVLAIVTPLFGRSLNFTEGMMEENQREEAATSSVERGQAHPRRSSKPATSLRFAELVEMVSILEEYDYDGQLGPYPKQNRLKGKIMDKVRRTLHEKFGLQRSRVQLSTKWSDLKRRNPEDLERIKKVLIRRK